MLGARSPGTGRFLSLAENAAKNNFPISATSRDGTVIPAVRRLVEEDAHVFKKVGAALHPIVHVCLPSFSQHRPISLFDSYRCVPMLGQHCFHLLKISITVVMSRFVQYGQSRQRGIVALVILPLDG